VGLIGYFTGLVSAELEWRDRVRLIVATFLTTAASVAVVHLFIPGRQTVGTVLFHSVELGLVYSACFFVISVLLTIAVRRARLESLRVWHFWTLSFIAFNLGYFLYAPADELGWAELHGSPSLNNAWLRYARLLPIWGAITHVFVLGHTKNVLRTELEQLRAAIASRSSERGTPSSSKIGLSSGKSTLLFDADLVSHITVEDHYCYLHHREGDTWKRTEIALPLKQVLQNLPPSFELVHRSHVINPLHLKRIDKEERAYRLTLDNDAVVPISRHRLKEVLPRMKAHLEERYGAQDSGHVSLPLVEKK
jgi:hypothetical protein